MNNYLQHFGLTHAPLGKQTRSLWDDGTAALARERFQWLLTSPGIGLLTGAKRHCCANARKHSIRTSTR